MSQDNSNVSARAFNSNTSEIVSYKYDSSIHADFNNLSESDDFDSHVSLESLFINFLQNPSTDIRIWFKPDLWLKSYLGLSDKQLEGIMVMSKAVWGTYQVSLFDVMRGYEFEQLNSFQVAFIDKLLAGSFNEPQVVTEVFK